MYKDHNKRVEKDIIPIVKLHFSNQTICWSCGKKMKTVYGTVNDAPIGPNEFNLEMIEISKNKGVIIQEIFSNSINESYLANICPHCKAFIGNFYLHDLWYNETEVIDIKDTKNFKVFKGVST